MKGRLICAQTTPSKRIYLVKANLRHVSIYLFTPHRFLSCTATGSPLPWRESNESINMPSGTVPTLFTSLSSCSPPTVFFLVQLRAHLYHEGSRTNLWTCPRELCQPSSRVYLAVHPPPSFFFYSYGLNSTMTAADMVYCIDAQVTATTTHIDIDIDW